MFKKNKFLNSLSLTRRNISVFFFSLLTSFLFKNKTKAQQKQTGTNTMFQISGRVSGPTPVEVRRNYLKSTHGQIHFRTSSPNKITSKRPLICLHMSPNSGRVYERFIGFMGTDRICLAPDTPGFGESDPPPSAPLIEDYASEFIKFIDNLNFESVDLLGYHTGSETCIEMGHQRPDLINRIAIISAPIFTEKERQEHREQFKHVEPKADGSFAVDKWVSAIKWRMEGWTLDHKAYQFNDALRNPDISWWGHRAAFEYEMEQKMRDNKKAVLVLNPEDDLVEYTKRAIGLSPLINIYDLPGWNHGFLDLEPEETASILRNHFDEEA